VTVAALPRRTPLEIDVRPGIEQAVSVLRDGYEPAAVRSLSQPADASRRVQADAILAK